MHQNAISFNMQIQGPVQMLASHNVARSKMVVVMSTTEIQITTGVRAMSLAIKGTTAVKTHPV